MKNEKDLFEVTPMPKKPVMSDENKELTTLQYPVSHLSEMTTDALLDIFNDYTCMYKAFNHEVYAARAQSILRILESRVAAKRASLPKEDIEVTTLNYTNSYLKTLTTDALLDFYSDYTSLYAAFKNVVYFVKAQSILRILEDRGAKQANKKALEEKSKRERGET